MNDMSVENKFAQYVAQTSPFPPSLRVARANGRWLFDETGRRYLDFISGIAVTNVGHCHPKLVQAVVDQATTYAHTMVYGEHIQQAQVELAEAIVSRAPASLNCVYFLTTGAEANDAALKMASKHTGRRRFVAFRRAYHGDTVGAMSCFGSGHFRDQFPGLTADVEFWEFGDAAVAGAIDESVAAVIVEPVQGEAGIVLPSEGFLQALRDACNRAGALLIFDEVQTGFGRTGEWFAAQTYGVTPDVITMAKGMGAGYPLAGLLAPRQMLYDFAAVPAFSHITTFGGHPVSCAAGLAGVRIIEEENLLQNCRDLGKWLLNELAVVAGEFAGVVTGVRGVGLMVGVEFASEPLARQVVDGCRGAGLILETTLLNEAVVRFSPALNVTMEECGFAIEQFRGVLAGITAETGSMAKPGTDESA